MLLTKFWDDSPCLPIPPSFPTTDASVLLLASHRCLLCLATTRCLTWLRFKLLLLLINGKKMKEGQNKQNLFLKDILYFLTAVLRELSPMTRLTFKTLTYAAGRRAGAGEQNLICSTKKHPCFYFGVKYSWLLGSAQVPPCISFCPCSELGEYRAAPSSEHTRSWLWSLHAAGQGMV